MTYIPWKRCIFVSYQMPFPQAGSGPDDSASANASTLTLCFQNTREHGRVDLEDVNRDIEALVDIVLV